MISLIVGLAALAAAQQANPLRSAVLATDDQLRLLPGLRVAGGAAGAVRPVRSLVSSDFSDLEFLGPLLSGVRIVQLGESGHGMAESNLLKVRLVRFLHERLGFDVVAFESDLYQCQDADRRAAQANAETTLRRCLLGVWHTRELLPLFEHIRTSRQGGRPLRLAGFDIQPIGTNKQHRPAFLAALTAVLDSGRARRIRQTDSTYLVEYGRGSAARRAWFRSNRDSLVQQYEGFAAWLDANRPALAEVAGRDSVLLARQTALSIAAYVRQQTAADNRGWAEQRDSSMAANVRFLADELFPGRRIIVWAHNYHVSHGNERIEPHEDVFPGVPARSMGSWLREWYGRELYTMGVYAHGGRAVNNARAEYEIPPPSGGSIEQRMAGANWRLAFLDLTQAWRAGFLGEAEVLTARFNGQIPRRMVPGEQYDAILFLGQVTPPIFLY